MKIEWHTDVNKKVKDVTHNRQCIVDEAVLRYMDPYIPYQTGTLAKSAVTGTVIGSGRIEQTTPYARYLYYGEVYGPSYPITSGGEVIGFFSKGPKHPTGRDIKYNTTKHPLAGKLWFERMKADHLDDIKKEAGLK